MHCSVIEHGMTSLSFQTAVQNIDKHARTNEHDHCCNSLVSTVINAGLGPGLKFECEIWGNVTK